MAPQIEVNAPQPQAHGPKWWIIGGSLVLLFLLAGCLCAYSLTLGGGGGEPATAGVAERVTKQFVQALQARDVEMAYQMSSEQIRPTLPKDKYSLLLDTDESWAVFKDYRDLQVCDWGFFITSNGRMLSAQGLFHYAQGDIIFRSVLRKDSDSAWRIYEFRLEPDKEPKPFGHCR
jgi:hypothetical protein